MHLLGDAAGWPAQGALWSLLLRGDLELAEMPSDLIERSRLLMEKYSDRPMRVADATLLAIAEVRGFKRIFTLDSDFDFYRVKGRERLERVP